MSEQDTGIYPPVPNEPKPSTSERIEAFLGKLTWALLKFSLVLFVFGFDVIVLIAIYRVLIK